MRASSRCEMRAFRDALRSTSPTSHQVPRLRHLGERSRFRSETGEIVLEGRLRRTEGRPLPIADRKRLRSQESSRASFHRILIRRHGGKHIGEVTCLLLQRGDQRVRGRHLGIQILGHLVDRSWFSLIRLPCLDDLAGDRQEHRRDHAGDGIRDAVQSVVRRLQEPARGRASQEIGDSFEIFGRRGVQYRRIERQAYVVLSNVDPEIGQARASRRPV